MDCITHFNCPIKNLQVSCVGGFGSNNYMYKINGTANITAIRAAAEKGELIQNVLNKWVIWVSLTYLSERTLVKVIEILFKCIMFVLLKRYRLFL